MGADPTVVRRRQQRGRDECGRIQIRRPRRWVGIETLLVRFGDDGPLLQVPLTYRGAPLEGGAASLITTMEHSVLGERWVYDATGDPVYVAAVATAAFTGGHEADVLYEVDGELLRRDPTASVVGSGRDGARVLPAPIVDIATRHERRRTVIEVGDLTVVVSRVLGEPHDDGGQTDAVHLADAGADADADAGSSAADADADLAPGTETRQVTLSGTWPGQPEPRVLVRAGISKSQR